MNTALLKKLLFPLGGKALLLHAPDPSVSGQLGLAETDALSAEDEIKEKNESEAGTFDFVLLFAEDVAALEANAPMALKAVRPDGLLWICYPKGTAKPKSDLNRDRGWQSVKSAGWEGVSLVSFDDTWSAMRFRPVGQRQASGTVRSNRTPSRSGTASSTEPLEAPEDFKTALAKSPEAETYFNGLAPSHRKEYINWITEAKREETRAGRIGSAVEKLLRKLKRPSDKPQ